MPFIGHHAIASELEVEVVVVEFDLAIDHLASRKRGGVRDRHVVQVVLEGLLTGYMILVHLGRWRDGHLFLGYVSVIAHVALLISVISIVM